MLCGNIMGPLEQKQKDRKAALILGVICILLSQLLITFKSEFGIAEIIHYISTTLLILSTIFGLIFVLRL